MLAKSHICGASRISSLLAKDEILQGSFVSHYRSLFATIGIGAVAALSAAVGLLAEASIARKQL